MRLAELSERSGVPTATIKYYLRERLLPPGERITTTKAEYDDTHLRRLRLVRALVQVGKMPVAAAREVLAAVEDESLDHHMRLGAAVWALPHDPAPTEETPEITAARGTADELLRRLGWQYGLELGPVSPAYGMLVNALAALARLSYPHTVENVLPYARIAGELAAADLDLVEEYETPAEQVEAAVALTVLLEPVLLSLRRLAEAEESHRRFGADSS